MARGRVYFLGGITGVFGDIRTARPSRRVDVFDPIAHAWTVGPELPEDAPKHHLAVTVWNDAIYVVGGPPPWPRVFQSRKGAGHSGRLLAVIFPHNRMQILPYNRVLKDLNGLTPAQLLEKLDGIFVLQKNSGAPLPARPHQLGLYLDGAWHTLTFREHFFRTKDPMEKLDVTLLQKFVLAPLLGIDDPRTSQRIHFVGGIRGTAELEKLVHSGEQACAFSMFPTGIEDLMAIADAGGIMPPKSTWFEPKLRDAMFCHLL